MSDSLELRDAVDLLKVSILRKPSKTSQATEVAEYRNYSQWLSSARHAEIVKAQKEASWCL